MPKEIIDITVPLRNGLACWPGDPETAIEPVSRISEGAGANISRYSFSSHAGTHVDPPYHFIDSGYKLDKIPLDHLIGPCRVVEFSGLDKITYADFESAGIPEGTERLLIKTRNSRIWQESPGTFKEDFVYITPEGADWLVERKVKLVGLDYLSVAEFKKGGPVHKKLLEIGTVLLEGVALSEAAPGDYTIVCLPLLVKDGDGAPARTVLIKGML